MLSVVSKAEEILIRRGVSHTMPTVQQLATLTPEEWLVVVDAIIDRTFLDDVRRCNLEQILDPVAISQRYYERQVASPQLLPPLMPWFISTRTKQ